MTIVGGGQLDVIAGASQCGKTHWVKQDIKRRKCKRIIAWDPEDQWSQLPGMQRITSARALIEAVKKPGPCMLSFVAGGDLREGFDHWAGCVFYAGMYVAGFDAVIAEELSDVSNAGKAPKNWGMLIRRGLKRGHHIYAISQRWAEADKTCMGNASKFVIFRQSLATDAAYLAQRTRVPLAEIDKLQPYHCVIYDTRTQDFSRHGPR